MTGAQKRFVDVPVGGVTLQGELQVPADASGTVVFAHGSGSSRLSPRNNAVAETLREEGFGTFLFDLLTPEEDLDRALRFDVELLRERLVAATEVLGETDESAELPVGYFGASTGAAAALRASIGRTDVAAVVCRGGRVDLASDVFGQVTSPTLLVVGGDDDQILELNKQAFERLTCEKELAVVPRAGHLFERPGALNEVTALAVEWYGRHFARIAA
ncbi:dienelactone hydrolase family protein [Haloarchaeobius sp. TZWWS8]|uniref:dienelactone hydrolase family protein n=1 Tax=Haloarchaeobius sp. TZWWS8 TaxID=3446121 RepID=UPI003EB9C5AE